MPLYEYECSKCGVVEDMASIKSEPLEVCPECGKEPVNRIISDNTFRCVGPRWASTNYGGGIDFDK